MRRFSSSYLPLLIAVFFLPVFQTCFLAFIALSTELIHHCLTSFQFGILYQSQICAVTFSRLFHWKSLLCSLLYVFITLLNVSPSTSLNFQPLCPPSPDCLLFLGLKKPLTPKSLNINLYYVVDFSTSKRLSNYNYLSVFFHLVSQKSGYCVHIVDL